MIIPASSTAAFLKDSESALRALRGAVLVSWQEGRPADLDAHVPTVRAIRESAQALELAAVKMVLDVLENELTAHRGLHEQLPEPIALGLLDMISHAEAETIKIGFLEEDRSIDLGDFLDRSFETLQMDPNGAFEPAAANETLSFLDTEDAFEPDAEMLEVFAMEAEDLLSNIETNLDNLLRTPTDRDSLWEIRRNAHTFKGAAGIIGLKVPSALAHRIEDLLDHLAQKEIVPERGVLDLITTSTQCLRAMVSGDRTDGTAARTADLYGSFEKLLAELRSPTRVVETRPTAVKAAVGNDKTEPATAEAATPAQRPIVRVSISRLDELVGSVRDLAVSRSAVEQQLADLQTQLDILAKVTRRLQMANARIETDYEGSMLVSQMPVSFGNYRDPFKAATSAASQNDDFDPLEMDQYTGFHESSRELSEAIQECFSINTALEASKAALESVISDQRRLIDETQERLIQIRLIRFGSILTRLQRAVRVACEEEKKKAEIVIENQEVELDTDVLDALVEPLMHLVRNAVAHGIESPETRRLVGKPESGTITISVVNQETHVVLKVSDDGRGIAWSTLKERAVQTGLIDPAAAVSLGPDGLRLLLFHPGLTTAEKLTMSAGRGVGMSIIKESVESRKGTISLETSAHQGTTFSLRIPLAFAFAQVLLVRTGGHLAAVPLKCVKEVIELVRSDLIQEAAGVTARIGGSSVPVRFLSDHFPPSKPGRGVGETFDALCMETSDGIFALVVDQVVKTEGTAIKPLGKPLDSVEGLLGAALLGNGEVVAVVDPTYLFRSPALTLESLSSDHVEAATSLVLIVDDSPSVRHMTSKVISAAGWEIITAKDGVEALELLKGARKPDIILSDVEMPRMDGYQLAAAVRSDGDIRNIPIVFITSRGSTKHREKAAELGISAYLTKPFVESELVDTVKRLTQNVLI